MSRSLTPLVLLAPLLMASQCRKPPVEAVDAIRDVETEVAGPDVEIQVVSVDPGFGPVEQSFPIQIYGSAFEEGAAVWFGEHESPEVDIRDSNTIHAMVPPMPAGQYDVVVANPDGAWASRRMGLSIGDLVIAELEACRQLVLHFDFNSADLLSQELDSLEALMPCLLSLPDRVSVEGHTDERGSTAFNLALGQRRADAIEQVLRGHGVESQRVRTISFGEERPSDLGHDDLSWQANRRVELKVVSQ